MKRRKIEIAAELAVHAYEHVEIEARGDAGGIIVGVIEHALVFFQIDTDDHLRTLAEDLAGTAQEGTRLVGFEIAKRGAGEKPDLWHRGDRFGQREWRGKIGRHRIDAERGEIPAQRVGLRLEEVAGNIHWNVGAEVALLQQQPDLGGGTGAEFDQRSALGESGRDLASAIAQDRKLGPGRIIFRQPGDRLEQFRTGHVVEVFRRKPLRTLRQVVDRIAGERRRLFVGKMRFSQRGSLHIHVSLLAARSRHGTRTLKWDSRRGAAP